MDHKDLTGILPEQYTGKEIIAEAVKELDTIEEARQFYQSARARLLDVNRWSETGSLPGTIFQVMDSDAEEVSREVQSFDYLRINVPGPASTAGDGFDWVYVEDLREVDEDDVQSTAFRVRPTSNPESSSNETAHFYSEESTSSFIITREGKKISALVVDRNIRANEESSTLGDKLRDQVYALGGITGMSKAQWQRLVDGVVASQ